MLAQSRRNRPLRCASEEILLQQAEDSHPYGMSDRSKLHQQSKRITNSEPVAQHVTQAHSEQRFSPSEEAYPFDL